METIKGFFDSFKEFVWDIIGYLLPGSFLLIILSACVDIAFFFDAAIINEKTNLFPFAFIVISYLLGHVVYGFGWLKERTLKRWSYTKKIEKSVSARDAFKLSKELIIKALAAKGVVNDLRNATVRDVRNLAMSFVPEADQKVYSFTFRSELSNHIGNISWVVGLLGIVSFFWKNIPLKIFLTTTNHIILYVCLIFAYILLRETRNRFYAISIGIPFSIYTAKATTA